VEWVHCDPIQLLGYAVFSHLARHSQGLLSLEKGIAPGKKQILLISSIYSHFLDHKTLRIIHLYYMTFDSTAINCLCFLITTTTCRFNSVYHGAFTAKKAPEPHHSGSGAFLTLTPLE
jgi:hypothetical protein